MVWCDWEDSPSRALKTPHWGVSAQRDAKRGHGLFESSLLLPHKIRAKQKEQHPIRYCPWCDREDSNLWPSGSENYDAAHDLMIYCTFLLVLHCHGTPITSNIK